jgi:threonine/homoserine/homoserine lactone efflux protein
MDYIFQGIGIGFILSIMIGPVFFVLMETSITKGFKAAMMLDLGVLISDIFYVVIALFFAYQLKSIDVGDFKNNMILSLFGGGLFISYGIYYLFLKKEKVAAVITEGQEIANVPSKASRDYTLLVFKGFTLNFLNPGVIIYWFAILAKGFDLVEEYHNNIHIVFFIATILLTYFGIDCLKALGASRLKPLVTNKLLRGLNQLIGFIFFGTGVFLILRQFVL